MKTVAELAQEYRAIPCTNVEAHSLAARRLSRKCAEVLSEAGLDASGFEARVVLYPKDTTP